MSSQSHCHCASIPSLPYCEQRLAPSMIYITLVYSDMWQIVLKITTYKINGHACSHTIKGGGHCIGNYNPTCDQGQSEVKWLRWNFEAGQAIKLGIGSSLRTVKVSPGDWWEWLMLISQGSRPDFWCDQEVKHENSMGQDLDPGRRWKYRRICSVPPCTMYNMYMCGNSKINGACSTDCWWRIRLVCIGVQGWVGVIHDFNVQSDEGTSLRIYSTPVHKSLFDWALTNKQLHVHCVRTNVNCNTLFKFVGIYSLKYHICSNRCLASTSSRSGFKMRPTFTRDHAAYITSTTNNRNTGKWPYQPHNWQTLSHPHSP